MLFQQTTPDTSGYMIAGYAVAFLVMGLYAASIRIRNRNLHQDLAMLEEMDEPAAEMEASHTGKAKKSTTKPSTKKVRK